MSLHYLYQEFVQGRALESNIVWLPFDGNRSHMSFTDVSHIPGGSFEFSFLPITTPWSAHTSTRIRSVYSLGFHAPSSSCAASFGAVCLSNNRWNATMSHSEVSFKDHCQPLLPTPTFSHAKIKWSDFPISCSFFRVSWNYEINLKAPTHSLILMKKKTKIKAHTSYSTFT